MKPIFTLIAFFTLFIGFSQNGELSGHITENIGTGFPGLTIELIQNGKSIKTTQTDFEGKYSFENIPYGIYSIKVNSLGMREETVENIVVEIQQKTMDFTYPKPCVGTKKVCPKGHKDKIIPIAYGLPTKQTMKKAENGKVKLGGCTSYCEKWHCVEHDLDF
jgi:hypothetical protein